MPAFIKTNISQNAFDCKPGQKYGKSEPSI